MAHAVADTLVMVAEMEVRRDRVAAFLDYAVANLAISRGWPGNLRFDILIDPERPERVRFDEEWESEEAQQAYLAWRIGEGDLTTLMSYLTGAPSFIALRRVAA